MYHHHHHHWAAVVCRGWANASACRLQVSLFCAVLFQIVSLQNLSRSSIHLLAGLTCRLFLSCGLCSGDKRCTSIFFEAVDMPRTISFFLALLIIYIIFVLSLTQMLVLLSSYVMLSILLFSLVCTAASLFCVGLVSVQVSAPYVMAGTIQELFTCLFR